MFYFLLFPSLANTCYPSGGKAGAPTIETDHQFEVITEALFKKNKKTCQIGVEFDTDTMEGFRIRRQVS
jgi:hypothetical protein